MALRAATHQSSWPKRSGVVAAGAAGAATAAGRPAPRRCCRRLLCRCCREVPRRELLLRCRQWAWGATATPEPLPPLAAAALGGGGRRAALDAMAAGGICLPLSITGVPIEGQGRGRLARWAGCDRGGLLGRLQRALLLLTAVQVIGMAMCGWAGRQTRADSCLARRRKSCMGGFSGCWVLELQALLGSSHLSAKRTSAASCRSPCSQRPFPLRRAFRCSSYPSNTRSMSWAAIAKAGPAKAEPAAEPSESKPRVAVLDANALITQHGILNLVRPACMRAMRRSQACRRCRSHLQTAAAAGLPAHPSLTLPHSCRCGLRTSA